MCHSNKTMSVICTHTYTRRPSYDANFGDDVKPVPRVPFKIVHCWLIVGEGIFDFEGIFTHIHTFHKCTCGGCLYEHLVCLSNL